MNIKKLLTKIPFLTIMVVIVILGALLYYFIFSYRQIYIESYDRQVTYDFARLRTTMTDVTIDEHFNRYDFKVLNSQKVIDDYILNSPYYQSTYNTKYDNQVYVFLYEGYPFKITYYTFTHTFILESMDILLYDDVVPYEFIVPFPELQLYITPNTEITWESITYAPYHDFQAFSTFYQSLDDSAVTIAEENKTIEIVPSIYEENVLSDEYIIVLTFSDSGIIITIEENG